MVIRDIKLLFEAGALQSANVISAVSATGYQLQFIRADQLEPVVLETKRGSCRLFQSYNTAIGVARQIGFTDVSVQLMPAPESTQE